MVTACLLIKTMLDTGHPVVAPIFNCVQSTARGSELAEHAARLPVHFWMLQQFSLTSWSKQLRVSHLPLLPQMQT